VEGIVSLPDYLLDEDDTPCRSCHEFIVYKRGLCEQCYADFMEAEAEEAYERKWERRIKDEHL
jgi:predicted amidophosphoribosyltransferase